MLAKRRGKEEKRKSILKLSSGFPRLVSTSFPCLLLDSIGFLKGFIGVGVPLFLFIFESFFPPSPTSWVEVAFMVLSQSSSFLSICTTSSKDVSRGESHSVSNPYGVQGS